MRARASPVTALRWKDAQFGPPLKGTLFEAHWRGKTRTQLSERIRTTMPPGGAGSLSAQGYTDVEAYILLANGGTASASAGPSASAPETTPCLRLPQRYARRTRPPSPR